jgi:hypothetical protein
VFAVPAVTVVSHRPVPAGSVHAPANAADGKQSIPINTQTPRFNKR